MRCLQCLFMLATERIWALSYANNPSVDEGQKQVETVSFRT